MINFKNFLLEGYNGDGDCMSAAADLMMRYHSSFFGKQIKATTSDPRGAVLVHALVHGQGSAKGLRFPHAWVEDGDTVIDVSNGRNIRMNKKIYYAFGRVDPKQKGAYYVYDYNEMKKKLKTQKYLMPKILLKLKNLIQMKNHKKKYRKILKL